MTVQRSQSRAGDRPGAEFAKLMVLALLSLAVAAGLYIQFDAEPMFALVAGACLFAVLALFRVALTRPAAPERSGIEDPAIPSELLGQLSEHVERLQSFASRVGDIDGLTERIEGLEQLMTSADRASPASDMAAAVDPVLTARLAQVDRLAADIDRLSAKLEAMRSRTQIENKEREEKLLGELKTLQSLVEQVALRMARGADKTPAAPSAPATPSAAIPEPAASGDPSPEPTGAWLDEAGERHEDAAADVAFIVLPGDTPEEGVLEAVRRAVESNNLDLYLQPIVTLPQRRVRYYEALTRLRDGAGGLLMPDRYLPVAEEAGMMPLIDNVMLYRSVQVLKRLSERSGARGVFCNISLHSLLDPDFFPELTAFLEQNQALNESLFFDLSQRMIESCGPIENESLDAIAKLGFRFGLDQVRNLDVDFAALHGRGFRYVKIEGELLLRRMAESGARIHAADMRAFLDRHGLELIVEKIEEERSLAELLEFDITLGQGYLFSEPRPVRPEVFERADSDTDATPEAPNPAPSKASPGSKSDAAAA